MKYKNYSMKFVDKLSQFKVKCKCGHVIVMINRKKDICDWCGRVIYRSKRDEFEDKLKKEIKK